MKIFPIQSAHRGWAIAAFIYSIIFLTIVILAYTNHLPSQLKQIPFYDTFGHFILYGIATYLGHHLLKRRRLQVLGITTPLWPLLFGIFTVTEECFQSLSIYRTFSFIDMIASILGLLFGYWLAERGNYRF